jgi:hypothetical protein
MSDKFQDLIEKLATTEPTESFSKLTETTMIDSLVDEDIKKLLKPLYDSTVITRNITACVLNSVFTEHKATFLFSRKILADLLKQDQNLKRNTVNSQSFRNLYDWWEDTKLLAVIKDGEHDRKASVVELTHHELIAAFITMTGKAFMELQRSRCIAVYDKGAHPMPSPKKKSQEKSPVSVSDSGTVPDPDYVPDDREDWTPTLEEIRKQQDEELKRRMERR